MRKLLAVLGFIFMAAAFFMTRPKPEYKAPILFHPDLVCPDAYDTELDYSNLAQSHVEIKLAPGCFSGWVRLPNWWLPEGAYFNHKGDPTGQWVSIWTSGYPRSCAPFNANAVREWHCGTTALPFRLQGQGTLVFYTNKHR